MTTAEHLSNGRAHQKPIGGEERAPSILNIKEHKYMTDTKHTPGPWFVIEGDSTVMYTGKNGRCYEVAQVFCDGNEGSRSANALLIAASPALYKYANKQALNGCKEAQSMLALWHLTK